MWKRFVQSSQIWRHELRNQIRNASIRVQGQEETTNLFKYVLGSIPVVTFGLGTWQVCRLQWKLDLIDKLSTQLKLPEVDLPTDLRQIEDLEYRKVRVRGRFDHSKEILMHPRSLITEKENTAAGSLISDQSQSGSWIITPFELTDRGYSILVNRGWVPKNKNDPQQRKEGQVEDEVTLTGILRKTEHRPQFGMKNDVKNDQWRHRDIEAMARKYNTAPVFIDAVRESSVPGGPIGGQTRVSLRNDHLSYLITWYSLSAITGYMFFAKVLRKHR